MVASSLFKTVKSDSSCRFLSKVATQYSTVNASKPYPVVLLTRKIFFEKNLELYTSQNIYLCVCVYFIHITVFH